MLQRNVRSVFRRSTLAEYVIRPLRGGRQDSLVEIKLRPTGRGRKGDDEPALLRYASFAPAGNGIVFVDQDNDIYYRRSVYDMVRKD